MNKLAIAVALVSVLIGLVAISSVGANFSKKQHHKHEGGEVHKPHHGHHQGHKVHKGHHGHHGHLKHEGGEVQKAHLGPGPKCNCPKFNCHGQRHPGGFNPHHGGENHHHEGAGEEEGRQGSFEGAGFGFGFKKEKEFDAGVRGEDKERDRNQFQKHQGFVAGEQDRFSGGESSSDVNSVEGVHKRKNINNNRVVVSESNRGNEDLDGFRLQNGHSQEGHFAGGENKFVGGESDESGSQEHESDKEFEAGVHKKDDVEGFGGAGTVKGQF